VVPQEALQNKQQVLSIIQGTDNDGIIVMRVADADQQKQYPPGSAYPYGDMSGYLGYSSSMAFDPAYLKTAKSVAVEVNAYATKDGHMVFSSRSETTNPESLDALVQSVARANVEKLRGQNLI